MKQKHERHRTASEKRVAANKKLDYMQSTKMTDDQRKAWNRKPYGLGDKDGHREDT